MLSAASLVVFLVLGNRVMVDVDVVGGRDDTHDKPRLRLRLVAVDDYCEDIYG